MAHPLVVFQEITHQNIIYSDNPDNGVTYGALYTWAAAMNGSASSNSNPSGIQGVCPDGWHLPSDQEWKEMEMYLGMSQTEADKIGWRGTVGGKLKEAGTAHCINPNTGATNESGYSALPGGRRYDNGSFDRLGYNARFWSTTGGGSEALIRVLSYNTTNVYRAYNVKHWGFSLKCLKD